MGLSYDDFRTCESLYYGRLAKRFYVNGSEIFKLLSGEFFIRTYSHLLTMVSLFTEVEIFRIQGRIVLLFLVNKTNTYIESVNVIESYTKKSFDGFEPGKLYELKNGQTWQQVNGPFAPNHLSTGYVRIINNEILMVDNWDYFPNVRRINT